MQQGQLKNIATLAVYTVVVLICNLHLFWGTAPTTLIYDEQMIAAGEWWRLFSHLPVHVSWYHLLLDGAAVAILWHELHLGSLLWKLLAAGICATGSLFFAIYTSPHIAKVGYCGLSGMAHGLVMLLGLIWIMNALTKRKTIRSNSFELWAGLTLVVVICIKSTLEVVVGALLFSPLHPADLGMPIVHAHFGGVLGGLSAFLLMCIQLRCRPLAATLTG